MARLQKFPALVKFLVSPQKLIAFREKLDSKHGTSDYIIFCKQQRHLLDSPQISIPISKHIIEHVNNLKNVN